MHISQDSRVNLVNKKVQSRNLTISEFLSNPQHYKVIWRDSAFVIVTIKLDKEKKVFVASALVENCDGDGYLVELDSAENENLYSAVTELNGSSDLNGLSGDIFNMLQRAFEKGFVDAIEIFYSGDDNKIKCIAKRNFQNIENDSLTCALDIISEKLTEKKTLRRKK
jgi:hypothetical protein